MSALFLSLCLVAGADPQLIAIIPVPARPAPAREEKYEHFVPLGLTADGARLIAQVGTDLVHWDVAANKLAARWEKALPDQSQDRAAVSEDGRWLGVANGRIWKLWSITDRRCVATFVLPHEAIRFLAVSPNGNTAVTVGRRDLRIWDVPTGREKASYSGASDVSWVASNTAFDEHIVFDRSTSELVWLTTTGAIRRVALRDTPVVDGPHADPFRLVRPIRATPDGKELVYPGEESWVTLDRETGAVISKVGQSTEKNDADLGKENAPRLWTLDRTGKRIISHAWGKDSYLRVIDRVDGRTIARHQYEAYESRELLAVSPTGDEAYLSRPEMNGFDAIETKTGKLARDLGPFGQLLEPGTKAEPDLSFKDGLFLSESQFLVLNQSWQLRLYDIQNPQQIVRQTTVPGDGRMHRMTLSPTGNTLAVVGYGNPYVSDDENVVPKLHLWNVHGGNWLSAELLPSPGEPLFTPDGEYVVIPCEGLERSTVYAVIDVFTGQRRHVLRAPEGLSGRLLPGPTGELGWERASYVDTPVFRFELDCKKGELRPIPVVWTKRWSADGRVSPDRRSELSPTDTKHKNLASPVLKRHRAVNSVYVSGYSRDDLRFSPDSRYFAIRTTTFLGDVFTGRCDTKALPGEFIAFSPSGDRIALQTEAGVGLVEKSSVLPRPSQALLSVMQARAHWRNLANLSPQAKTERPVFEAAMLALVASPASALEAAQTELKPARPLADATLRSLFAQLDNPSPDAQLAAFDQLATMDRRILAKITELQKSEASHEAKRLARKAAEAIPDDAPTQPQDIQAVNAVEVLERIGTADSAKLLARLAEGDPAATLTREAIAAHYRLSRLQELRGRR